MDNTMVKLYFIPDYVTFTWCKEQEEHYHLFLEDYAEVVEDEVINIIEEAGVDLYETLQNLKEEGIAHIAWYSGDSRKMSGLYYLLSLFEIRSFPGGKGKEDIIINLNTSKNRTLEKLNLVMTLNKMKGKENGC